MLSMFDTAHRYFHWHSKNVTTWLWLLDSCGFRKGFPWPPVKIMGITSRAYSNMWKRIRYVSKITFNHDQLRCDLAKVSLGITSNWSLRCCRGSWQGGGLVLRRFWTGQGSLLRCGLRRWSLCVKGQGMCTSCGRFCSWRRRGGAWCWMLLCRLSSTTVRRLTWSPGYQVRSSI